MRVIVTGSLGTIGKPLVAELRNRGHDVLGVDRSHSGDEQFIRADVTQRRQLEKAFLKHRPEAVYHLAAEFGRFNGEEFYEDLWPTAMIGTRNILELCKLGNAHLIFASSSEVYGENDATVLYEDLTHDGQCWQPNEYALSKWANEVQIVNFQRRRGLRATRLRFFNAYGPGESWTPYRSVVAQFVHNALAGKPLTVYEGYRRAFMYVDDFVPTLAYTCEAEHLSYDVYNVGGADYRSVEELAAIVREQVGSVDVELLPEEKHNVRNKQPDLTRARMELGHDPRVRLEAGVPLTVEWMRRQQSDPAPLVTMEMRACP